MVFGLALERISEGVECVINIACLNLRTKFGTTVLLFEVGDRVLPRAERYVLQTVRKMTRV